MLSLEPQVQGFGRKRWLSITAYPIKSVSGDVNVVVLTEDVSERKKAEEALRRQANLIDLSPDAILVRAIDGTITFWSKALKKLYGFSVNEAQGQVAHKLLKTQFPMIA